MLPYLRRWVFLFLLYSPLLRNLKLRSCYMPGTVLPFLRSRFMRQMAIPIVHVRKGDTEVRRSV